MIHSRKKHQFTIKQQVLTNDNHPGEWTPKSLSDKINGEVVIGYLFKTVDGKFEAKTKVLNLYTIKEEYVCNPKKIIYAKTLSNAYIQWLETLIHDPESKVFRNPPVKEWMDTKDNWIKKLAGQLSKQYNKTYDDCLSSIHYSIMKCYSKGHVYMGNLSYISRTAHNDIKMDYRFMRNKLTTNNPCMSSLDEELGAFGAAANAENTTTLHELIGEADPYYKAEDLAELKEEILVDLRPMFSEREIDQILNTPVSLLTMTIYRKLLKWRVKHKAEDYTNE